MTGQGDDGACGLGNSVTGNTTVTDQENMTDSLEHLADLSDGGSEKR